MEHPRQASPSAEASDALPASDELADKVAEDLALTPAASQDVVAESAQTVPLEEEKVKDEIEIQIDLLSDPDWVVRREAVITLGEMVVMPVSQALAARFAPEDKRARYLAFFGLSWAVPSMLGPWMAGMVMDKLDPRWVWYAGGILLGIAILAFLRLHQIASKRIDSIDQSRKPAASTLES